MNKCTYHLLIVLALGMLYTHARAKQIETEENIDQNKVLISKTVKAIREKILKHWIRPNVIPSALSCTILVDLLPGGRVKNIRVTRSGDKNFDQSAISAVRRALPFPIPKEIFERFKTFSFSFRSADSTHSFANSVQIETEEDIDQNKVLISKTVKAIREKILKHWIRPNKTPPALSCTMQVNFLSGGKVENIQVIRNSGDQNFDQSAISAVRRASPFPIPKEIFERFKTFSFSFMSPGSTHSSTDSVPMSFAKQPQFIIVTIDSQGKLFLDDDKQPLSSSELSIQIMAKLRRNPQSEVRLKADAYLPYGEIVQLLELLQEAGIEEIHLDKIGLLTK